MMETLKEKRRVFEAIKPKIWRQLSHECSNCGATEKLHLHHIVPLVKGGSNRITNITPLCEECHSRVHFEIGEFENGKGFNISGVVKKYDFDKNQLQRMYEEGKTHAEMAEVIGCSPSHVSLKLREFNISKDRSFLAIEKFELWLYEFSIKPVGSKVKAKTVYEDKIGVGRSHFRHIKNDSRVLSLMTSLGIKLVGHNFVKVSNTKVETWKDVI
ncbi:HNH endonuclease [Gracilibacillus lacisalsi]|uniref:HNH endonuclease n=1 Tax=Gracilibacillus lacisalsi TaxID=393087 RepID=UPI000378FB0E|nr:HNH endonuclease [Gracilibacillus lacisalsi]